MTRCPDPSDTAFKTDITPRMGDTCSGTRFTCGRSVGECSEVSVAFVDLEDPVANWFVDTNTDRTVQTEATTQAAMTTATAAATATPPATATTTAAMAMTTATISIRQRQDPPISGGTRETSRA